MNIRTRLRHVVALWKESSFPLPLCLDAFRLMPIDYIARFKDTNFLLKGNVGEWNTIVENIIQRDYLKNGIKISEGSVVIDVGANFGAFTVLASGMVGQTGFIHSFEPNPHVFARLERNLDLNNVKNAKAYCECIGGSDGEVEFYISSKSSMSSLYRSVDGRNESDPIVERVPMKSINSVLEEIGPIDLLKIDCEGAEFEIFDGVDDTLLRNVMQISMEVHTIPGRNPEDIRRKLKKNEFRVEDTFPMTAFRV